MTAVLSTGKSPVLTSVVIFVSAAAIKSLAVIFSRVFSFGISFEFSLWFSFTFDLHTSFASVSFISPKFKSSRFVGNMFFTYHNLSFC